MPAFALFGLPPKFGYLGTAGSPIIAAEDSAGLTAAGIPQLGVNNTWTGRQTLNDLRYGGTVGGYSGISTSTSFTPGSKAALLLYAPSDANTYIGSVDTKNVVIKPAWGANFFTFETGALRVTNNVMTLGVAGGRWSEIYAVNATINTSDEREKEQIEDIPDDLLDVWEGVRWRVFKWREAVAKKGDDARLHAGLIAQEVHQVLEARGVDGFKLGLLCYDVWAARSEFEGREILGEDGQPLLDANGSELVEIVEHVIPGGDAWGVRYEQAMAFELAFQRRRGDRMQAALEALTARVEALEAGQ